MELTHWSYISHDDNTPMGGTNTLQIMGWHAGFGSQSIARGKLNGIGNLYSMVGSTEIGDG